MWSCVAGIYHGYPLYLKQGCPLIEAGAGYIDEEPYLIGKASCVYQVPDTNELHGIPDTNMVNIGCHYFDWNYAYGTLKSDLYRDKVVNFVDFAFLAAGWLTIYDMNDLVSMADEWMEIAEPNVQISFDKDPNNLSGYVNMSIDAPDPDIYRVFALIDGRLHLEFLVGTEEDPYVGIQTERFVNGPHSIKIVSADYDLNVVCSQTKEVVFNNELSCARVDKGYELGKDFHFYAFSEGPSTLYTVEVNDIIADNTVYSGNFTGHINGGIPSDAFADDSQVYEMTIKDSAGSINFNKIISRDFEAEGGFEEYLSESVMNSAGSSESTGGLSACSLGRASSIGDPNTYKVIISIGLECLEMQCKDVIDKIITQSNARFGSKSVLFLGFNQSRWPHVKYRIKSLPNVKIWIHMTHGRPPIPILNPIQAVGFKDEFVSAFPNYRENHSLTELHFQDIAPKLNFVFFHACDSMDTTQFSDALGITAPPPWLPLDSVFIGWYGEAWYGKNLKADYNGYLVELFDLLIGNSKSLYDAITEVPDTIRGKNVVEENLRWAGPLSAQHVYYNWPEISKP